MSSKKLFGVVFCALVALFFYYSGYKIVTEEETRYPGKVRCEGSICGYRLDTTEHIKKRYIVSVCYKIKGNEETPVDLNKRYTDSTRIELGKPISVWVNTQDPTDFSFTFSDETNRNGITVFALAGIMTLIFFFALVTALKSKKAKDDPESLSP